MSFPGSKENVKSGKFRLKTASYTSPTMHQTSFLSLKASILSLVACKALIQSTSWPNLWFPLSGLFDSGIGSPSVK
jgi:hypothetical protein